MLTVVVPQGSVYSLETTSSNTHNDQTDRETSNRTARLGNDSGDSRHDQNDVSHQSTRDGCKDGAESTPVLISDERASQGHDVGPELIDCVSGLEMTTLDPCFSAAYSHNVRPVDARCPMPRAPGTSLLKSAPAARAPVLEFGGRGRWMKLTTRKRVSTTTGDNNTVMPPFYSHTAVVP